MELVIKQSNRGDMRKIHARLQFFKASSRHGDLIKKTKKPFLDKVKGSMCAKFQVCIVFRLTSRRDTNKYIHKEIHKYRVFFYRYTHVSFHYSKTIVVTLTNFKTLKLDYMSHLYPKSQYSA